MKTTEKADLSSKVVLSGQYLCVNQILKRLEMALSFTLRLGRSPFDFFTILKINLSVRIVIKIRFGIMNIVKQTAETRQQTSISFCHEIADC